MRKFIIIIGALLVVLGGAFALLRGGDEEGAAKIAKPSSLSSAPSLGGKPSIAAVPGGAEGTSSHEAAEGGNGEG